MVDSRPITLSERDRDLITRLAATEADHSLARSNPEQYRLQVGGIVDVVLNRIASSQFPDDISGVANQDRQFSAINGPPSTRKYGGRVENVPDGDVPSVLRQTVEEHLDARMRGEPSLVGGALHYANPHYSSPSNLGWINALEGPTFGDGNRIHVHGTTQGFTPVEARLAHPNVAAVYEAKQAFIQQLFQFESSTPSAAVEPANTVHLTFDDGPETESTGKILDTLKQGGHRATFFWTLEHMQANSELVDRALREGHRVEVHHNELFKNMSDSQVGQVIGDTKSFIEGRIQALEAQGHDIVQERVKYIRSPGGDAAGKHHVFSEHGLQHQLWDIDTKDWSTRVSDEQVIAAASQAREGSVVLLHDQAEHLTGGQVADRTEYVLPQIIANLESKGLRSAPVREKASVGTPAQATQIDSPELESMTASASGTKAAGYHLAIEAVRARAGITDEQLSAKGVDIAKFNAERGLVSTDGLSDERVREKIDSGKWMQIGEGDDKQYVDLENASFGTESKKALNATREHLAEMKDKQPEQYERIVERFKEDHERAEAERTRERATRRVRDHMVNQGQGINSIEDLFAYAILSLLVGRAAADKIMGIDSAYRGPDGRNYNVPGNSPSLRYDGSQDYRAPTDESYDDKKVPKHGLDLESVPYADIDTSAMKPTVDENGHKWVAFAVATDWGKKANGKPVAQAMFVMRNLDTGEEKRFSMLTGGAGRSESSRGGPSPGFVSGDYHEHKDLRAEYDVNFAQFDHGRGAAFTGSDGRSYFIHLLNPIEGVRTEIGIHPDGGWNGTAGCWGINPDQAAAFRKAWKEVGGFDKIYIGDPKTVRDSQRRVKDKGQGIFTPEPQADPKTPTPDKTPAAPSKDGNIDKASFDGSPARLSSAIARAEALYGPSQSSHKDDDGDKSRLGGLSPSVIATVDTEKKKAREAAVT